MQGSAPIGGEALVVPKSWKVNYVAEMGAKENIYAGEFISSE